MSDSREAHAVVAQFRHAASQLGQISTDLDRHATVIDPLADDLAANIKVHSINVHALQKGIIALADRFQVAATRRS